MDENVSIRYNKKLKKQKLKLPNKIYMRGPDDYFKRLTTTGFNKYESSHHSLYGKSNTKKNEHNN